jgi:hypothetical protein
MTVTPTMYIDAVTQNNDCRVIKIENKEGYKHIAFVDRNGHQWTKKLKITTDDRKSRRAKKSYRGF